MAHLPELIQITVLLVINSELPICTKDDSRMVGKPILFLCPCVQFSNPSVLPIKQHAKELTTILVSKQNLIFYWRRNHPSCKLKAPSSNNFLHQDSYHRTHSLFVCCSFFLYLHKWQGRREQKCVWFMETTQLLIMCEI